VEHYEATMFPVRFRREADMGGRIVPIISAAHDPNQSLQRFRCDERWELV